MSAIHWSQFRPGPHSQLVAMAAISHFLQVGLRLHSSSSNAQPAAASHVVWSVVSGQSVAEHDPAAGGGKIKHFVQSSLSFEIDCWHVAQLAEMSSKPTVVIKV